MTFEEAVKISDTNSAIRKVIVGNIERVYLRFKTGPNFELTYVLGDRLSHHSREVPVDELEGYNDWKPNC